MEFWQNIPFFCIMMSMLFGIVTSVLPNRIAKWGSVFLCATVGILNVILLAYLIPYGDSFSYYMGHYSAPWGNEIRAGSLEALLVIVFSFVMLLGILGGMKKMDVQIDAHKHSLVFIMFDLVLAATISMIYTNDLFTGYVFVEILTISACALIMSRQNGRTLVSAMRYMMLSLLGSGMILMAIAMTYNITGHLLMENIRESIDALVATGQYELPLTVILGLFFVGLGIKSGLCPFHTWLPDAYGYSTPAAGAVLSSVVSKAYIILLIKIYCRMIGYDFAQQNHAMDLLFLFGVAGMILGSLDAIGSHDLRRMVAYSSVAQIGYIYAGLGLGVTVGIVAALYHMVMHSVAKSALFIASSSLSDVSGDRKHFADLRGAGYRHKTAGILFTVAALSMIGVPVLGGFVSKMYLSQAAFEHGGVKMWVMLLALALSTLLNVLYFLKTAITLYRPAREGFVAPVVQKSPQRTVVMWVFIIANIAVGLCAKPIITIIADGLTLFS